MGASLSFPKHNIKNLGNETQFNPRSMCHVNPSSLAPEPIALVDSTFIPGLVWLNESGCISPVEAFYDTDNQEIVVNDFEYFGSLALAFTDRAQLLTSV